MNRRAVLVWAVRVLAVPAAATLAALLAWPLSTYEWVWVGTATVGTADMALGLGIFERAFGPDDGGPS